ncbi:HEAT repeat domain-containing protein [Siphonobacter sp. SORGH_AS_0500]|uniref:HEAT repeat domain-containing protein n=1 Tax=Siphonobacter sp. SORGH_AS_0500 TaxID=1864824 RepID=UPI000CBA0F1C|nr:HEAT repeat domain-containing protein [Siphonobacter sp. SORGH_AS_0500]MDR6192995.1 hypothetical protein [Siphonobacter sp. SORGH_AS_0500]PKK35718.1 hypothetical protein BWI96_15540 [Siphonobacter sp. SORGH_AS_0500]
MEKDTLLIDYLLGRLSEPERLAFEEMLASDLPLRQEAESLEKIWRDVQRYEVEPDAGLDTAFYALLDREKENQTLESQHQQEANVIPLPKKRVYWPYAAVLAAFGIMFWLGRMTVAPEIKTQTVTIEKPSYRPLETPPAEEVAQLEPSTKEETKDVSIKKVQQEVATLRKELKVTQELVVLGLLRKESAAERLKGLQYASNMPSLPPDLLQALAQTLRKDENINVRLATLETLKSYGKNPSVRKALLARLNAASELPEQISVMETLVINKETAALPRLKQLAEDEAADPIIRKQAQQSIQLLTI